MADMEAVTALPTLFGRHPRMAFAADPARLGQGPSFVAHGWQESPVTRE